MQEYLVVDLALLERTPVGAAVEESHVGRQVIRTVVGGVLLHGVERGIALALDLLEPEGLGGTEGERREEGSAAGLDVSLGTLDRILRLLYLYVVLQGVGNAIVE